MIVKTIVLDANTLYLKRQDWVLPENLERFEFDWLNRLTVHDKDNENLKYLLSTSCFWKNYRKIVDVHPNEKKLVKS